jgi:hypothetical protein
MTTLIVYESFWGNTETVARAVADGIDGPVEVVDVGKAPSAVPGDVDLLVVGGPTHAFGMTRATTRHDAVNQGGEPSHEETGIREWLAALTTVPGLDVATFDTRAAAVRRLPGSAARGAARTVSHKHLGHVVDSESFYVEGTPGPLLEGEVERARAWGRTLRS